MIHAPLFEELGTDQTVVTGSAPTWHTLLTITIAIDEPDSNLLVVASASGAFDGAGSSGDMNVYLRVRLDGTVMQGAEAGTRFATNTSWSSATTKAYAPDAGGQPRVGSHTLTFEWASDVGTATILAAAQPSAMHASFYVEEVSAGHGAPSFEDLSADHTTTEGTYTTLLDALTITTTGRSLTEKPGFFAALATDQAAPHSFAALVSVAVEIAEATAQLFISASLSIEQKTADATISIDVYLDGVSLGKGASVTTEHDSGGVQGNFRNVTTMACPTLSAGAHTVELRWKTSADDTTCNAFTQPDSQTARLFAQEKAA